MIQSNYKQESARVAQGLQFHQQGNLPGAEQVYLSIMERSPKHPDALHLLGVLKGQQGLHSTGIELIEEAISESPRVSAYHNNLGNLCMKTGDLALAEASYRRALKIDRKNADAHLNLGKMLHAKSLLTEARACILSSVRLAPRSLEAQMSLGRVEESAKNDQAALQSFRNAIRIDPKYAPAHLACGNSLKALGELDAAVESYRTAIALDPAYADAHFNLGNVLRAQGKLSEAVAVYRNAAKIDPAGASDIYNNLGLTFAGLGQQEEAAEAFLDAARLSSTSEEAWFNLGQQAARMGNPKLAEEYFHKALSLNPHYAEARLELGNLRLAAGQYEEAVAFYGAAIESAPSNAAAHNNLGAAFSELKQRQAALEAYRKAIAIKPDYDEAVFNLGKELSLCGEHHAAMKTLRDAIAINPGNASAYTQLGTILYDRGFLEDSATALRRSLEIDATSKIARGNLGLVLSLLGDTHGLDLLEEIVREQPDSHADRWAWSEKLLLHGRFEEGWREHEARVRVEEFVSQHRSFTQPRWTGEPLDGKTILLYAEQGQGDTIQFARYAGMVAQRGGRVVLEVPRSLRRLLAGQPGVAECIVHGDTPPEFATWAPLMSLPYLLGTRADTIPAPSSPVPLPASSSGERGPLKVGLVWAGNSKDKRDHLRSSRLEQWAALAKLDGVEFTSLQAGEAGLQASEPGSPFQFAQDVSGAKDFADTAAIMAGLDLVISVDTAVAHLAGTLNKPAWILLYNLVDWRWGLTGSETPWYPTAKLFRQTTPADWTQVMGEVEASLKALLASRASS